MSTSSNGGGRSIPSAPTTTYEAPLRVRFAPMASGFPAKRRVQYPRPMTATAGAPVLSSAGVKVRPRAAWTPSTSKKLAETRAPGSCSGRSPSVALNRSFAIAARPLSFESRAASSTKAGNENGPSAMARFGLDADTMNRRPGSVNGSGRSSAASTMLKTAVLAPTPIATIATATSVNSRAFSNDRIAYRMLDRACSLEYRSLSGHYGPADIAVVTCPATDSAEEYPSRAALPAAT